MFSEDQGFFGLWLMFSEDQVLDPGLCFQRPRIFGSWLMFSEDHGFFGLWLMFSENQRFWILAHVFRGLGFLDLGLCFQKTKGFLGFGSCFQRTKGSGSWLMFLEDQGFFGLWLMFSEDQRFWILAHVFKGLGFLDLS